MNKKKYSIKDIAELSGVSVATVSRVINNNGRFSEETRRKVEKVIEETGYRTNYTAKSLRMNKSFTIGILVPDITNYFFAEIVQNLEELLFDKNYSSIICNTNRDPKKEQAYLNILESKGVDGLIVISGAEMFDYRTYSNANKAIPYICVNREPKNIEDTIFIVSNNYQGAFEATEELINMGCKHPVIALHERQSTFGNQRFEGFKEALQKHHIPYSKNTNQLFINRSNEPTAQLKQFLTHNPKTDGIFAFTDKIAVSLLASLRKLNIHVPKEIKLIGFDDTPQNKYMSPTLSSVEQNTTQIASVAVDNLLKLIDHPEQTGKSFEIPVSLQLRESSQKN
jgi:LacI family transcriptional regulator